MSSKYERLVQRRESLMQQFSKGEISRRSYLMEMGAISLKADRKAKRILPTNEDSTHSATINMANESDSNDSLSETRPFGEASECSSDSEQEDPFEKPPVRTGNDPRAVKTSSKNKAHQRQICPSCKKGFQLKRSPPLHIACSECSKLYHKRCRDVAAMPFVCAKCRTPAMNTLVNSSEAAPSMNPCVNYSEMARQSGSEVLDEVSVVNAGS